ncbi:type II toxin-antitoxin system RelE/ParE family toxin [Halomonas sp. HNIBRBA4712]|uniref:type II toxin-antitoxin system RelE/ParE family toxin n=1 Tax=Halomonas sp. HNIBRBA4712 TaxID=3373087 RepID=UPI003746A352
MIESFKDKRLEAFYFSGATAASIPASITSALGRKLDLIDAAVSEADLRVPPGNRFEHLEGKLSSLSAIRVNKQYRLIFEWSHGRARGLYLDPHTYR